MISILLKYLSKENYLILYLITSSDILEDEYLIPKNIKRISLSKQKINIFEAIEKEELDIFVYNFYSKKDIKKLNKLKKTKIIYYNHSCFTYWIYFGLNFNQSIYPLYRNCKFVISLPFIFI